MRRLSVVLGLCLGIAAAGCEPEADGTGAPGASGGAEPEARAELTDRDGKRVGTATFRQEEAGVRIALDLSGLPPGMHALHVHEKAECDAPDFQGAGGHFNPFGRKHGWLSTDGPHAGDLPNIRVGDDGTLKAEFLAPLLTLREGKNSLFAGEGTSLLIHAKPDDGTTDPAGAAGERIACGPIRKAAP